MKAEQYIASRGFVPFCADDDCRSSVSARAAVFAPRGIGIIPTPSSGLIAERFAAPADTENDVLPRLR